MRVGLTLSGHDAEPHSTEFCRGEKFDAMLAWMTSLPAGAYPAVESFARNAEYKPSDILSAELNEAANKHAPPEDGAAEAVETLLDLIGLGYSDETAAVEV